MSERYLEDFTVGQKFGSGRIVIDKDGIRRFAAEFDPQPFHLDEEAAKNTMFGGMAASCGRHGDDSLSGADVLSARRLPI